MKRDWKLLAALVVLIGLVVWLLAISLDRSKELDGVRREINELKTLTSTRPAITTIEGRTPVIGVDYFNGRDGNDGKDGRDGVDGAPGENGRDGKDGKDGESAYQTAVKNGFVGTEQQWLESLKATPLLVLDLNCIDGYLAKKYAPLDSFWQLTNIKCEVDHE